MSWSNRLLTLGLLFALAACGFQPLYGTRTGSGEAVSADLAAIAVSPIEDRQGQQLRNFLLDRLTPAGKSGRSLYTLDVVLTRTVTELGYRKDETTTRAQITITADFILKEGDKTRLHNASRAVASYNILEARFASVMAERDAETRALRQIADDIRTRLALHFSDPSAAK